MIGFGARALAVTALLALSACAPLAGPSQSAAGREPDILQRTLKIVVRVEPATATEPSASGLGRLARRLFSSGLAANDASGAAIPVLAEAIPQLNTDTWRVFPDGKMETVFRLRPDLTWHDGTPLTAEDFAFGRKVQAQRIAWGHIGPTDSAIEEVFAPDSRTVVIRWREPFAEADTSNGTPFPRHILEAPLAQGEAQAFGSLPYWTAEYVGAGPFRMAGWAPGAFIEGTAFENYALGRPRIDRVELSFSTDPAVNAVRLLAGAAHVAVDTALQYEQAVTLRREWGGAGGTVILSPTQLRYLQVQHRPDYQKTPALLDLRVRKAMLHSLDRQSLADALLEGDGVIAEGLIPSTVGYYAQVDAAIAKYPYDLRRAEQLFAEAGFTLGPDGFYVGPGGRLSPQVRGVSEGQEGQETTIVADQLRRGKIDSVLDMIPAAQRNQSDEIKGTFPGLTTNYNTLSAGFGFSKMHTSRIGAPENRWTGTNRIGWSNPEFDRLFDAWNGALDRNQRNQYMLQMGKLVNDQLPVFPLYLNFEVVAHVAGVRGPLGGDPDTTPYYNLHEWRWES